MVNDLECIDEFIKWQERISHYTVATVRTNRTVLKRWARFLAERKEHTLRHAKILSVLAYIDKRKNADGVKDLTVSHDLCILRTFYHYLVRFGGSSNPTGSLPEFVCNTYHEGTFLTIDEMFLMLDNVDIAAISGPRNYCIIALLWSLGLRTSELLHLQWRDIDLEDGTLLVRCGKGRKQRQLILNDKLQENMRNYRRHVLGGPTNPVFCALGKRKNQHAEMSTRELLAVCADTAQRAGIATKVTPLTLRHTFATHMYEAGVSVRDIQEMMGHTTMTETTVYLHVTAEAARRVLNEHDYQKDYYRGEA